MANLRKPLSWQALMTRFKRRNGVARSARTTTVVGNSSPCCNGWGWPREARKEIEAALRLAPSKVSFYRVRAHTYYMERDFPKAIAAYREALAWEPHHLRAYGCIANEGGYVEPVLATLTGRRCSCTPSTGMTAQKATNHSAGRRSLTDLPRSQSA